MDGPSYAHVGSRFCAPSASGRGTGKMADDVLGVGQEGTWSQCLYGRNGEATTTILPQMLYRDICTAEDQPYSVAISPTRQCVAFGCKSGVELYWVDPTTGQNLNRWFRLNKAADHIYFLPVRRGKDSPLRLRLISSTKYAPPTDNGPTCYTSLSAPHDSWFTLRASWHLPLLNAANRQQSTSNEWTAGADHSNAIPLSDGHHILFTDNATGTLCLGSDTPAGNVQRLARKIFFEPPRPSTGVIGTDAHRVPMLYAASHDLTHGILIAAVYGEDLILYCVPIDILRYSTAEQESTIIDSSVPFRELVELSLLPHPVSNATALQQSGEVVNKTENERFERLNALWLHHLPSPGSGERQRTSLGDVWPVRVTGRCIGSVRGCAALAVRGNVADGGIVWAVDHRSLAFSRILRSLKA